MAMFIIFPTDYSSCFFGGYSGTAVIFVYYQNANIWQIRGALHGAQWRVPTNFILYVSTMMLVLLNLSLIRF